ncbi:MAG: hypothetical protein ACLFU6_06240 [Candidatus Hydrogenedentota bacterium]
MRWTKYVVLAGLAGVLALGSRSAHGEETFEPAGLLLTWQQDPLTTMTIDWRSYEERDSVPHVFPNYHVPAYPSHRSYDGGVQTQVRENWVPLFEGNNIQVAFENHDHAYKRTYPIRDGEISSDGIVYLGDGAWGVGTRSGDSQDEWYMDQFASERHAIIATIHGAHRKFVMVNEHGEIIDEYPR